MWSWRRVPYMDQATESDVWGRKFGQRGLSGLICWGLNHEFIWNYRVRFPLTRHIHHCCTLLQSNQLENLHISCIYSNMSRSNLGWLKYWLLQGLTTSQASLEQGSQNVFALTSLSNVFSLSKKTKAERCFVLLCHVAILSWTLKAMWPGYVYIPTFLI